MVEVLGFEPNQDKTNRFTVCRASPSAPNLHEEIIPQQKHDCKLFDSFILSCYSISSYKGIYIMGVFMYVIGVASGGMLFMDLVESTKTIPVLKSIVTIIISLIIVILLIMQYKIFKKIKNEKIRNK